MDGQAPKWHFAKYFRSVETCQFSELNMNWTLLSHLQAVLQEKLKYAIYFCKSIDTDEYARVAMGDPTEATGSEDNSEIESVSRNYF